jgi:DNA polymerase I-like protein with 3'-5' exonuclease and polymerase domains
VADKAKVSTELDPKTLQQISEALQETREFRKYVVAGYNSCAITQAQYAQLGVRFQAPDGLAREIDSLLSKPSLSPDEHTKLAALIGQYADLAPQLGTP